MDHLERFRGSYDENLRLIAARRSALVAAAKQRVPVNLAELLAAASPANEITQDLGWVSAPDPRDDTASPERIEVLPTLSFWVGDEEDGIEPGLAGITLVGKLPSGEERVIGTISTIGSYDPMLLLNTTPDNDMATRETGWDNADAELFLALAESAFQLLDV